ncbi:MAG TPA: TonB family protein [Coleofasciculaceae cyanobacterium]|jgi:TonB family protein
MTISGQPTSNPFKTASQSVKAKDGATPGKSPLSTRAGSKAHRGISRVGTENRLAHLSMRRASVFSVGLHVLSPLLLVVATILMLLLLNINIWDWLKPKSTPADLEFTLVNDTQATRPENPKFKGNFNQRAGGKTNKDQPLKAFEKTPTSPAKKGAPPTPTAQPEQPQQAMQPPAPTKPDATKPPAKPQFTPAIATAKPPEPASTPSEAQPAKAASAAPTSAAPTPLVSIGAPNGDAFAGSGLSDASLGNPQAGDSATPGVDVAQDIDFGPFMADLERRIKRNWMPPRGSESRRVKLLFYLARDGRVLKVETSKPSGDEEADRAAIAAVQSSAPFMAFPPQVQEDVLPVEFTFDYNVLNSKNAKRGLKW